jgi:hypothetical protein
VIAGKSRGCGCQRTALPIAAVALAFLRFGLRTLRSIARCGPADVIALLEPTSRPAPRVPLVAFGRDELPPAGFPFGHESLLETFMECTANA